MRAVGETSAESESSSRSMAWAAFECRWALKESGASGGRVGGGVCIGLEMVIIAVVGGERKKNGTIVGGGPTILVPRVLCTPNT